MAKNNGAGFARALLHAHEQDNVFGLGNTGCTNAKDVLRDTQADVINNAWGVKLGKGYSGSDSDLMADVKNQLLLEYANSKRGMSTIAVDLGSPC
jgi:hypothetical protein